MTQTSKAQDVIAYSIRFARLDSTPDTYGKGLTYTIIDRTPSDYYVITGTRANLATLSRRATNANDLNDIGMNA